MGGDRTCFALFLVLLLFYTPYEREVGCSCRSYHFIEPLLGQ
jgi:hypothetical protein